MSGITALGPQQALDVPPQWKRMPPRLIAWQPAYDLAYELVNGQGAGLNQGPHHVPGFLIDTWKMWQQAVYRLSAMAFGSAAVRREPSYEYATAWQTRSGIESQLHVIPDVTIETAAALYVVDAKYKTRFKNEGMKATSADIHQAAATVPPLGALKSLLVVPSDTKLAGHCELIRSIVVSASNVEIAEVEVGIRGIAAVGGVRKIANALRSLLDSSFGRYKITAA